MSIQIAIDDLEELNVALGAIKVELPGALFECKDIERIQKAIIILSDGKITNNDIEFLELRIKELEDKQIEDKDYLPGTNRVTIAYDWARVVCQRVERNVGRMWNWWYLPESLKYIRELAKLLRLLSASHE